MFIWLFVRTLPFFFFFAIWALHRLRIPELCSNGPINATELFTSLV